MPIEIRVHKFGTFAPGARITAVYAGIGNTAIHTTTGNWREFLVKKGWVNIPRIWE